MTTNGDSGIRNPKSEIRNKNWLWFFGVTIALGIAAMAINWIYNVRQQLTLEQLTAAEKLWSEKGPPDYDLTIDKQYSSAASSGEANHETIEVRVRQKQVVAAPLDGRPMEPRLLPDYDMPAWFDYVEVFMKRDTAPDAPPTFRTAIFDAQTGALLHYRRRVRGTYERQELTIRILS